MYKSLFYLAVFGLVYAQVVLAQGVRSQLKLFYGRQHELVREIMGSSLFLQNNIVFSPESISQANFVDGLLTGPTIGKSFFEKVFAKIIESPKAQSSNYTEYTTLNKIFYDKKMNSTYGTDNNPLAISSDEVDFSINTESVRSYINNIVAQNTNNLIENFFEYLSPDTEAVLVNAIYFKGSWQMPFNVDYTEKALFKSPSGDTEVEMMSGDILARHIVYNNADVVELPYKDTDGLSMIVLLPNDEEADLKAFAETLDLSVVNDMLSNTARKNIAFSMPKLDLDSNFGLNTVPNFLLRNFNDINHHVRIVVNESGTEAAAATGGIPFRMTFLDMVCDHPYLFAVYNKVLGSILFFGAVVDP